MPFSRRSARPDSKYLPPPSATRRHLKRGRTPRSCIVLLVILFLAVATFVFNRFRPAPISISLIAHKPSISPTRTARLSAAAGKLSIIVLFHAEYESLRFAARSWVSNGLINIADELVIFLNGLPSPVATLLMARVPELRAVRDTGKLRVVPSSENMPLGLAIAKMVELAKYEYVLLLEKDWELIEPYDVVFSRIADSKVLLKEGVADVVRHRHRINPGVPLHALIMHQGREESILRIQKNLLCYTHHWQDDPTDSYPGKGLMWKCGRGANQDADLDEAHIFCATSEYCQWTNNPVLFKRRWFIDEVGNEFRKQYKIEKDKEGADSPFLDFEYYTNWRSYAWTDKNFTIAVGTGLFRHAEQNEQTNFNTFWYAHYRLTVDFEEVRDQYLGNETEFKKLGGVHTPPGVEMPSMMERYPVDFARKYHWNRTFTGNLATQREMINEVYQPYLDKYRILSGEEWNVSGADSTKANMVVDWRSVVTSLHQATEKAMMIAPPEMPHEMTITLVTSLLDIGRNDLAKDDYQFKRDFKMYLDAMEDWLTHKYLKVVYTTQQVVDEMMPRMSNETKASTKFVITSREDLRNKWLGPDNYEKVQEIRTSREWTDRASWLENSPQGGLKDYNPLVMSKMFMMRDAARENYWETSHFLFIDAKHNCRRPKVFTPKNDHIVRAHMFGKLLLTHFDYTPSTEVHGFEYKAFNSYCNQKNIDERQLVKVGRGGIFGGSAFVLEAITAMYDAVLTATLRAGLMGTEENILSILFYQVPQYIDAFSNNWACPENLKGDHECQSMKDQQGYNCAIFDWVARDAVEEEE